MTIDVRPFISRSSASMTTCSDAASRPGGRLVENQDRRVANDRARDRDALALTAGQRHAALADHRGVAVRHLDDELVRVGQFGGADRVFDLRVGLAVGDVLPDRAAEQQRVLQDEADLIAQRLQRELADVVCRRSGSGPTADRRSAGSGSTMRRLAGARRPDDRRDLARLDREADVLQDRRACRRS